MHDERWDRLTQAADALRERLEVSPRVAITLGSGLSDGFGLPVGGARIPCGEIPGFPVPTVAGHTGEFWSGRIGEVPVLLQRGRVHFYEGRTLDEVTFATRLFAVLGVKVLIVTNASGAIRPDLRAGDLVLITDHINMLGANPLHGANLDPLGPRFPDMSSAYTPRLRAIAHAAADAEGIQLKEGVYVATLGPSYETPAEIRSFRALGADLVGMSTVPEVIAAAHAGMEVLGISLATNLAAGVDPNAALSHEEVIETTKRKGAEMRRLLLAVLPRL
ncbi:MAG: purine-nucleoside phosphorylase [Candidatus Bipolaricaulis sp.]|nr:purine-nucleoside phosphorylase [Candidatus Bipolaricaulis sp.]MDD5645774.1 purine-nucleoside phosphorylase [Candidatus Bipolaricaulis sp.]